MMRLRGPLLRGMPFFTCFWGHKVTSLLTNTRRFFKPHNVLDFGLDFGLNFCPKFGGTLLQIL
jgi:hypothetical protein